MKRLSICFFICFGMVAILAQSSYADFKDAYKAIRKVGMQIESGTDKKTFSGLIADAKTEIDFLKIDKKNEKCVWHLKKALGAYEILNTIWNSQERGKLAGASFIATEKYDSWIKAYPAMLTYRWGSTGVGVAPTNEAKSKDGNYCLIIEGVFRDVWVPCLSEEANKSLDNAKNCIN